MSTGKHFSGAGQSSAVGMFMTAKTELNDDKLTEKVVMYSQGQVNSFKILSEEQRGELYYIKIQANIDKDILQSAAKVSQKQTVSLNVSNIAASNQTEEDKLQSRVEILSEAMKQINYASLINYYAYPRVIKNDKGEDKIYLIHMLAFNMDNYMKIISNMDSVFSKIAIKKETGAFVDYHYNKSAYELAKNYKNITDVIKYKGMWINQLNAVRQTTDDKYNCINTYRISHSSGNYLNKGWYALVNKFTSFTAYQLYDSSDEDSIKNNLSEILKNIQQKFNITFIAESGTGFDSELARDSAEFSIGDSYFLYPIFFKDTPPYDRSSVFIFLQLLNLSKEQMVSLKEITGRYELERKK